MPAFIIAPSIVNNGYNKQLIGQKKWANLFFSCDAL